MTEEQLRNFVLDALAYPASSREAFLRAKCGDDAAAAERALHLLATIGVEETRIFSPEEAPTHVPPPRSGASPARIGPYTLVRMLGEGGFGAVYLADQQEPVSRQVALKVLKAGFDSHQVIERFDAERQALSLMDNPHIAKVLDAGTTAEGQPYFAMEYVPGETITRYCDGANLSIPDRLSLFAQVCAAVQHAHTKGIIHRDLKPGNVLVTTHDGKPFVKVIDFGIAKATGGQLSAKKFFTEHRQLIGTPEYMSPEQAEGSPDIDTRTDVYSLGVMLYELLIGVTPFDAERLRAAAYGEIHRIIREVDPPRPSTRLSTVGDTLSSLALRRRTQPHRLTSLIRGELDWIVMKCLEKDRARRYESPGALAQDLARHLAGRPVLAAPPGAGYLARKFVSRHRVGVAAAVMVVLALAAGLALSVAGYNAARRGEQAAIESERAAKDEAVKAKAALDFVADMFASLDPNAAQGSQVTVAEVLDPAAKKITDTFSGQPVSEGLVRSIIGQAYFYLARYDDASREMTRALELRRGAGVPDDAETWTLLHNLAGVAIETDELDRAESLLNEALAGRRKALGEADRDTLASRSNLAYVRQLKGDLEGAAADIRVIAADQEKALGPNDKDTIESLSSLADMLEDLGQLDEAIAIANDAAQRAEAALGPESGAALTARSIQSEALSTAARFDEAAALLERIGKSKERVYGPNHPSTLISLDMLASVYASQMKDDAAIEIHRRVLDGAIASLGEKHRATLTYMNNLAQSLRYVNRLDEAEPLYRRAVELNAEVRGINDQSTLITKSNLALLLSARGNQIEAVQILTEALAGFKASLPPGHWMIGTAGVNLADPLIALKRWEEAEKILLESNDILVKALGPTHGRVKHCRDALVKVYEGWSMPDKAAAWK